MLTVVSNLVRLSALAATGLMLISASCFGGRGNDAQTPEDETTTSETLASPPTTLPTLAAPAPAPPTEPPQVPQPPQLPPTTSILPEPPPPQPSPPTTQATDPGCPSRPDESANYPYEVQAGDTLWFLANCFGVTVDAIVEASSVENPSLIQPGDNLLIPPTSN